MNASRTLFVAAVLGGLSVFMGAFGAHALKPLLEANQRTETFELAVRYQFFHALALLFLGLWIKQSNTKLARWAGLSFLLGTILFSGSLYFLSFTNSKSLVMATPVGGLCFLAGWILLATSFVVQKK